MTYSTITAALEGYLTAALATVTSPAVITQIRPGEPDTVDLPTVAYWYLGQKTWEANTFTKTQEQWGWRIRVIVPTGPRAVPMDTNLEQWMADLINAIRGQLWGNVGAGGANTGGGMELTDARTDWGIYGGQLCRVATMDWWPMLSNVHDIAY